MAPTLASTFRAMAYNNAWANHRLLKACAALTAEEFAATRTSFFPSLVATLNHNLTIDWFYVDALEGGRLGPKAWENPIPNPALADLMAEQKAVDRRLIAHCDGLTDEMLGMEVRVNRITREQVERRDRLLMHLFQHQVHHRGQAHAMLAGTRVKPPQLDEFFSIGEAGLRAEEFWELGFSEDGIWGLEGVR